MDESEETVGKVKTARLIWQGNLHFSARIPPGEQAGIVAELLRRLWGLMAGDRFCLAEVPTDSDTREILRDTDRLEAGKLYELMCIGTAV